MNENILLLIELGGLLLVGAGTILTIVAFALRLGRQLGSIQTTSSATNESLTTYSKTNAEDHKLIREEIGHASEVMQRNCDEIEKTVNTVEERVEKTEQRVSKLEEERAL